MEGNGWLVMLVLFPMAWGIFVWCMGRKRKELGDFLAMVAVTLELILMCVLVLSVKKADVRMPEICGMGIHFTLDGFRGLYGLIIAFMWTMTTYFSKEYLKHDEKRTRYHMFNLVTLGAVMGVFLSADLFTTFIFFEIMSFASYVWVAQEEKKEALKAAETYLAVSVIGGLVMLMGLFLVYRNLGTLEIAQLLPAASDFENKVLLYIAGGCILVGFGAKAGAFPLHIWLPKAHPVAPAPASALLSGILTKSGIFGILVISCNLFLHDRSWGELLLVLGLFTMFIGALLGVFSVDIKRTLACSSMSQIGFILIGIGMQGILGEENVLAVRGTLLHMVNHSLIKLVLFLVAGVIVMNTHKLNLNEIRGFGRKKPLLHFSFLMGALGIGGIPLWNGYISKTLLHESIVEGIHLTSVASDFRGYVLLQGAEWIFILSGAMTVCYMAKLYFAVFIEKNKNELVQKEYDAKKKYMSPLSACSILVGAVLLPIMGMFPRFTMDLWADAGQGFMGEVSLHQPVEYFHMVNLKGGLITIGIGVLLYIGIRKWLMKKDERGMSYIQAWPKWLDLENMLYRPVLLRILPLSLGVVCRGLDSLVDGCILLLRKTIYRDRKIPHELAEGSSFTHALGCFCDWIRMIRYRLRHKEVPKGIISYEHKFAMQRKKIMETNTIIGRSLSFGLLLFYVGLVFTLIYLLLA